MDNWSARSGERVFGNTREEGKHTRLLVIHAARNMTVSGQVVVRNPEAFDFHSVSVEGCDGIKAEVFRVKSTVFNDGEPYPDRLVPAAPERIPANFSAVFRIILTVPKDYPVGRKTVTVKMLVADRTEEYQWTVVVHSPVLPDAKDSEFGHEYFFDIWGCYGASDPKKHAYSFPVLSEEWWEFMKTIARTMKQMRINSLYLHTVSLLAAGGSKRTGESEWSFDFSLIDKFIELYLEYGSFRYITLCGETHCVTGETVSAIDYEGKEVSFKSGSAEGDAWTRALYGSVYRHFTEKGWAGMLRMHIEDEPHTSDHWLHAREIIREVAPGVKCSEPLDTCGIAFECGDNCDIGIPRIDVFEDERHFWRNRIRSGAETWVYSCCYPFDLGWLNKFIDLPHRFSRMMKWACYANGIKGFLHWGFNYWEGSYYGLHPDGWFKGDGFIVYPDTENNSLLPSVRGISTVEGIEEWELLNMLGKHDRGAACSIANRVAESFTKYSHDATSADIDLARAEVLELIDAYNG